MALFQTRCLIWLLTVALSVEASRPAEQSLVLAARSFQHEPNHTVTNSSRQQTLSKAEKDVLVQAVANGVQAKKHLHVITSSFVSQQLQTRDRSSWGDFKSFMKDIAVGFVSAVNDGVSIAQGATADIPILFNTLKDFAQGFNVSTVSDAISNNKIASMLGAVPPAFMTIGALAGFTSSLWELIDLMKEELNNACECLNQLLRRKRIIGVIDFILASMAVLGDTNIQTLLLSASGGTVAAALPGLIILGAISRLGALAMRVFATPYLLVWEDACQHACDAGSVLADTMTPRPEDIAGKSYLDSAELAQTETDMQTWKDAYDKEVAKVTWQEYEDKVMEALADTQHGVGGSQLNGNRQQRIELGQNINISANERLTKTVQQRQFEERNAPGGECDLMRGFSQAPGAATEDECKKYKRKCVRYEKGMVVFDPNDSWLIEKCCGGCFENCAKRANWRSPPDCA